MTAHPGIHLLLDRDAAEPASEVLGPWVTVHRLDSSGHGLLTVRPDGHIGYRSAQLHLEGLSAWLDLVAAR